MGEVVVCQVHVEELAEDAVLEVREFPAPEGPAGLRGEPALRGLRLPVRGDGGDDDPVAGLEVFDLFPYFVHDPEGLVPQDEVVPVPDCPFPDGVDIGGARRERQRPDDSVPWTAGRSVLLDPSNLTDP